MGDSEINLTFETIFETLRREKSKEDLQKLDNEFYINLMGYLKDKSDFLKEKKDNNEFFSVPETQKSRVQLENIKRVIKELYDKRERKILNMAINKSRTNSGIIDTSTLMEEERGLYENVVNTLIKTRQKLLLNLIEERFESSIRKEKEIMEDKTHYAEQAEQLSHIMRDESKDKPKEQHSMKFTKVRFLGPINTFVGKDLESYGPFEPGEEANLPEEIADLLVRKGNAETL